MIGDLLESGLGRNLLGRRFDGWPPNQAWTSDITYLLTDEGWLYLAAIVDLGTRQIVGWAMSARMIAQLVCDALQMAYWGRRPAPGCWSTRTAAVSMPAASTEGCTSNFT
jgi:transposase InsO family protein